MVTVYGIVPGSYADKKGIKVGDKLHTVNGSEINDVLDYRFYLTDSKVLLTLERDGVFYEIEILKEMYADIGLEFETYLMDKKRSCLNRCIFCFIDQLPKGLRETLYFKDDDSRLSFLHGNYITLTNLKEEDVDRIIKMRISPINISVHTVNPELRVQMMKNKNAGKVLSYLKKLKDAHIELNLQIVLCKGVNDGAELDRSMEEIAKLYPEASSVSVVPAGLTKFRDNLYPLSPYTPCECARIIKQVTDFGDKCLEKYGSRIFFLGDEFYIKSGTPIPNEDFYEGYPQIENGVGMLASMEGEFAYALETAEQGETEKRTVSLATGYAAYDFIDKLARTAQENFKGLKVNTFKIKNNFFGENITVAGLLTGKDVIEQLSDAAKNGELGEKLLLPRVMLRSEGDLTLDGMTPGEISEALGVEIEFVESDGTALLDAIVGV